VESAPRRLSLAGGSQGESLTVRTGDLPRLFHRLNNQLGVVLANAELLEKRIADDAHRARAGQVVSGVLEAIATVQHIRRAASPSVEEARSVPSEE